ncbi:MAG: hypothetical protein EZS28_052850, partial [Streblomastix strix]
TAIGMLFRIQGFQEKEIYGFALKQMLKKPQYATRKKRKEEPIYKLDILLRYIQGKFGYIEQLSEQEHMGCVISSIMAFATLRLTEIHRAKATRNEDDSWQLDTAVWKGDDYDLTVTFRPVSNRQICPTLLLLQILIGFQLIRKASGSLIPTLCQSIFIYCKIGGSLIPTSCSFISIYCKIGGSLIPTSCCKIGGSLIPTSCSLNILRWVKGGMLPTH